MTEFPGNREIIIETTKCGNQLKVCAVDVASGMEVSILAPINAMEADRNRIVMRKLQKRLQDTGQIQPQSKTPPGKGRGMIV